MSNEKLTLTPIQIIYQEITFGDTLSEGPRRELWALCLVGKFSGHVVGGRKWIFSLEGFIHLIPVFRIVFAIFTIFVMNSFSSHF